MIKIGGPDGWATHKGSLSLVDPSRFGEPLVLVRNGQNMQFKLDTNTFSGITGWDSGSIQRSDAGQVKGICQMFTGWLVGASQQIGSSAAELKDYWADDCVQTIQDPSADPGVNIWFTEPSKTNSGQGSWFTGALIDYEGDKATLVAVLGFNGYPYAADPSAAQ